MGNVRCRFCSKEFSWTKTFICGNCEHKLDIVFLKDALEIKRPKTLDYWADHFKRTYTREEVLGSFWRMIATRRMYLTADRKMGAR